MTAQKKIIFLFLNQNICCGYSKESSHWDGSFEHPKHMFKLTGKKIINQNFTIKRFVNCDPWSTFFGPFTIGPYIRLCNQSLNFLFLKQNICCGYSKEQSHWHGSFEHPKYLFKLMGKKIIKILRLKIVLILTHDRCLITFFVFRNHLPYSFSSLKDK